MDPETRPPSQPTQAKPTSPLPPGYARIDREHPIGGQMSDIVQGLFTRTRLPWLLQHHSQVAVLAIFSFINGCISIGLMSILAVITGSPFIFPSLGPTAFLFFYTPTAPSASPRNTLVGHAVGALAGYLSLIITGLTTAGPALSVGVTWPRVFAAALSLGLTAGVMVLLKSPHPPAGATTLIVSLGILKEPWQLLLLMIAVLLLTLQAIAINRLAGIPYPLWSPLRNPPADLGKGT
ncbi:HPP family protein [Ktedonosporobacter rubrisoli]|uniref:HPP family protein n=1 Tax=Ktedonosporobacter rubrisoli TaxID=2509675 RepID=A0A4V0YZA1_KTERU|nr:HPP family protein [Ktedonosporobacter rubrisoli]QBD79001.1 HPP family protein [Ktedonosporobacter rubrisoli]